MSEKNFNSVDRDVLLQAAQDAGLTVTEQSAYAKLTFGESPAKIYVARTQKVTRVDLSGFTLEHEGVNQVSREEAKELKLGKVEAQLDFEKDNETVLAAFAEACEALKAVPPKAKKPKKTAEPKAETEAETTEETEAEETEAEETEAEEPEEVGYAPFNTAAQDDDDEVTEFGSEFETNNAQ